MEVSDESNSDKSGASERHSKCDKYGLHRDKVHFSFREPFILKGYRQTNMKVVDYLKSIFIHYSNETTNVWSHFLAFVYFVVYFWNYFNAGLSDPFMWPLLCHALGIMLFCLMSSVAHTFNSMSRAARNTCFCVDYAAINIYSVGACQAFYFYSRPLDADFPSSLFFTILSIILSVICTVLCCLTRYRWHSLRFLLRTLTFAMPYFMATAPFLSRMFLDCQFGSCKDVLPGFLYSSVFFVLTGIANVSRLPERWFPGVFDSFGQSHNLMHLFTAIGAAMQFNTVKLDMMNRKQILLSHPNQVASRDSFLYFFISIPINICIAIWYGSRTHSVTPEKDQTFEKIKKQ